MIKKFFVLLMLACLLNLNLNKAQAAGVKRIVRQSQQANKNNKNKNNIDNEIKSQQKAKTDVELKIKQYNEVAKQKARESENLLGQINKLKRDANESQSKIKELESENSRLESSIKNLNKDIAKLNSEMEKLLVKLRQRVLSIYKYNSQENLNLLFSAQDTHEALINAYNFSYLLNEDKSIVDNLLEKSNKLKSSRRQLEENSAQIKVKRGELVKKQSEFNTAVKDTNNLLKDIQAQQSKALTASKELENSQRDIGNRIINLTRQKEAQAKALAEREAKARAQAQAKANANKAQAKNNNSQAKANNNKAPTKAQASTSNSNSTPTRNLAAASLEWPVRGKISAPYGSRIHPVFKTKVFNSGIDIKASQGAPVRAAAGGEVLYTGWMRGFGQVVILDHGGNISTVYAHLASAQVKEGQSVRAGSVLGTVGNSGTESEYALHFEVRKGGSAQNPINYLKKG